MAEDKSNSSFDPAKAEVFAGQFLTTLNHGALCLTGSHRPPARHASLHDLDHALSLAQGGEGLGAMWGEEKTREYLQKAGFRSVETKNLAHDIQNNWYLVRK